MISFPSYNSFFLIIYFWDNVEFNKSDNPNKFSGGEIFGIIVGVFVLAAMVGFVIFAALVYSGVVKKPDIKKPNLKMPKSFKS